MMWMTSILNLVENSFVALTNMLKKQNTQVQIAKDFFASRGYSPRTVSISHPDFEEIITFGTPSNGGSVQFDLGPGFRKDGNYELWVTTDFYDLTRNQA